MLKSMLFAPFSSPCTLFSCLFCDKNRHFAPFSLSIYLVAHDFFHPQKRHLVAKNLLFEVVFPKKSNSFHPFYGYQLLQKQQKVAI